VRAFGDADVAGLHPGDVVARIEGVATERAVRARVGAAATDRARDWALRHLLAGPRTGSLRLEASDEHGLRQVTIERRAPAAAHDPAVAARRMGDARDLGYLRVRDAPSDAFLVAELDAELTRLGHTRALIVDLRGYAGPRSRAATRAFLARFAARGKAWQVRERASGARIVDTVPEAPADPRLRSRRGAPLVVLVNRWTEGEAEALAAGLHAAAGARLVGTAMAGMKGELHRVRLAHSGIELRYPAERVFLPDGTPRAVLRPEIEVDLAAPSGGPGDPILYQALKLLEQASAASS
jgi:carboxyl-terminal processing protease